MRELDLVAPWKANDRPRHRLWQVQRTTSPCAATSSWRPVTLQPGAALPARHFDEELQVRRPTKRSNGYRHEIERLLEVERGFDLGECR